jgi:hypothetical protein
MSGKLIFMLSLACMSSCATKTQSGALAGGGLGAGTGALIGGRRGALIGGAVGVIGGAAVGAALDEQDRQIMELQTPHAYHQIERRRQLSLGDIKDLTDAHISDAVIISQIQATNSVFFLSSRDIIELKQAGVSQRVIDEMISTSSY